MISSFSFIIFSLMFTSKYFVSSYGSYKPTSSIMSMIKLKCRLLIVGQCSSKAIDYDELDDSLKSKAISWYPGHIAKAERELAEYIKKVDVVIELRDARIPFATTHPLVPSWVGNKPLIVAIARIDQISRVALAELKEYYAFNPAHPGKTGVKVYFIDGKRGAGVLTLKKQALKASIDLNIKREQRGIQPRPVRAAVIGFPNVGKSALINRLLGRKMAKSQNLPGVTRSLRWVRLGGAENSTPNNIELLDSPGIIPAKHLDQKSAVKLAICNDIGEASYDRVVVAAAMCDQLNELYKSKKHYVDMSKIESRYDLAFRELSGEEVVFKVASKFYKGNEISAADKLLGDFRRGFLGFNSLDFVPNSRESKDISKRYQNNEKPFKIQPPSISVLDVGKGNYEGW